MEDPPFPGEAKGIQIHEVGASVEAPGKAILTLTSVTREPMEVLGDFGEFDEVKVELSYRYLTDSYDDTFAVVVSLIGDDGLFYELVEFDRDRLPIPRLRADAGASMAFGHSYAVPPTTKRLKTIAAGGVNAVFDTDL